MLVAIGSPTILQSRYLRTHSKPWRARYAIRESYDNSLAIIEVDHKHPVKATLLFLIIDHSLSTWTTLDCNIKQRVEVEAQFTQLLPLRITIKPSTFSVRIRIKSWPRVSVEFSRKSSLGGLTWLKAWHSAHCTRYTKTLTKSPPHDYHRSRGVETSKTSVLRCMLYRM